MKRVTPIINELLAGWKLIPVAGQQNEACNALEKYCGIDYLLTNDEQVYGLSSKVQYGKNYRTFTLSKSEYAKRNEASDTRCMLPDYTMQGYVNNGEIIGLAMVETEALLNFIERRLAEERGKFYVCGWDKLRDAGYDVREYNSEQEDGKAEALSPDTQEKVKWHEAYQRNLAEQHEEENCAECDMREVCNTLEKFLENMPE